MGRPIKNIVGVTFGNLTVDSFHSLVGGVASWNCICSCGNTVTVPSHYLKNKCNNPSCGCLTGKTKPGKIGADRVEVKEMKVLSGPVTPEYLSFTERWRKRQAQAAAYKLSQYHLLGKMEAEKYHKSMYNGNGVEY